MTSLATLKEVKQENDRVIKFIKPQDGFVFSGARFPAFVSAWGTGKTMSGIARGMRLSQSYPNNLGVIFRKEYTDLRDSTIKDFENYTKLTVNSQREIVLENGSVIMFRHLEEFNNIQNINLGWFMIEQAEELDSDDQFFKLFGRLRRKDVPHSGFIIANTNGHNWIYKLWKLGQLEGGDLFEATTYENVHNLPEDFIKSLEVLKREKPTVYNRFVLNSWDESDSVDIIIKQEVIEKSKGRELNEILPVRKIISIDVSRYGDDKTVFIAIENNSEVAKEVHEKKSTMECVGLALAFAKKHKIESFAVDEIGVGGGVADRLAELDKDVIFVNAAERANVRSDCYNRRAEIYLNGAELFDSGRVSILKTDHELAEQLGWAKYKTIKSNGIFQVEPKDDIKKRFGRSPDEADAFLNGLWALPQVKPVKHEDKYEKALNWGRELVGSGMTV
jgi:phage terminase large subunit